MSLEKIYRLVLILGSWGVATCALAIQAGRVITDGAEIHQFPNRTSPQLSTVRQNTTLKMSSKLVQDVHGEFWYKVRLPDSTSGNDYGYVRAPDVLAMSLKDDLKEAGIDSEMNVDAHEPFPWFLLIRAMGLGGTGIVTLADGSGTVVPSFEYGGEAEFSVCPFVFTHGYWHRFFALGAAYQYFPADSMIAASAIFRFFTQKTWEPEIRLRFADGLTTGLLFAGINFGVQFPFTLDSRSYFAGYLEFGDLVGFPLGAAPIHVYGSGGVGFHF